MPNAVTPATERPRFRHDHLVAETIEDNGTKFIDVLDPDSGSMFRFYEVEFSLACGMDGERDVAGLVRWAQDELGLAATPSEVTTVIATLGELGYLDRTAEAKAAAAAPPSAPAGSAAESELAPGIVVGAKPVVAAPEVELGSAGSTGTPIAEAMPTAPDLDLGAPGTSEASPPPREPVEEVALGAPGRAEIGHDDKTVSEPSEVSLDLSQHMGVEPSDVQEAVRASKVMQAVELPKELADALESKPAEPAPAPVAAKPVVEDKQPVAEEPKPAAVAAKPVVEDKQPVVEEPKPAIVAKPVEKPVVEEKQPVVPAAAPARVSPVLVVLLILVIGGAGAYVVWKYVLNKADATTKTSMVKQPVEPTPPPPPDPEPPAPVIKLAADAPAAIEVKAPDAGVLESIVAAGPVKSGDVVARFAGTRSIESAISGLDREIKRVEGELAKAKEDLAEAQAANSAGRIKSAEARVADRQSSLDDKQEKRAAKQAELDKLVLKAPADGAVTPIAKSRARLAVDAAVFSILPDKQLIATFDSDAPPSPGTKVYVLVKTSETKLLCKVLSVEVGVKVGCPYDAALEGTEVSFGGVVPEEGAPAEDKPAEAAGSDGSAATP